jgi:hypothetical protein
MSYVIRQLHARGHSALASEATTVALVEALKRGEIVRGKYLEWSDPNAKKGRGAERWTDDPARAVRFDSKEAAMACWQAQSTVKPLRSDGRPNKPMTAWTVTIEEAAE